MAAQDRTWPFTVDAYELLPPPVMRQNPAYYHSLLAEARFVAEKGMVDYKIEVRKGWSTTR